MINNTAPFNGFDITVNSSDISKLKPYGVDLVGSIMPASSPILAECVGTVLVVGSTCAATDNPTTVHLALSSFTLFPTGTTGLLFTAIFSITGTTPPGGVTIRYQNRCDPKTSSNGNLCVSFANGTTTPVPESVQTGGFDNSNTSMLPYAILTTPTTNLGISLPGAPTHALPLATYTATSQNGFNTSSTPAQLTLAASVNGTGIRPTVSLSKSVLDLTNVPRGKFNQTGSVSSTVPAGIYFATVTATYQALDMNTFTTSSLSATYSLPINVTGFKITATSPSSQPVGTAAASTITVTIYKAFYKPVTLANNTIPNLLCLTITPASFTTNGTATVSCVSTIAGTYALTITGSGGTLSFSTTATFTFQNHDVAISSSFTTTPSGQATVGTKITVNVQLQNKGTGDEMVLVTLHVDTGLTIAPAQNVTVHANSNQTVTFTWDSSSYTAKTYTLTVTIQLSHNEQNIESNSAGLGTYSLQPVSGSPTLDTTTIAIIGIVVALGVVGTILVVRRRRKSPNSSQPST